MREVGHTIERGHLGWGVGSIVVVIIVIAGLCYCFEASEIVSKEIKKMTLDCRTRVAGIPIPWGMGRMLGSWGL